MYDDRYMSRCTGQSIQWDREGRFSQPWALETGAPTELF